MMQKQYSVMNDPVIPVVFLDGRLKETGIRELLIHAHEIADLRCSSPLEEYAVFRLLVALATDMLRPIRWLDRQEQLEKRRFDPETVDAYIAMCEADGPRFDLFDPEHPFMQSAFDAEQDEKAIKPIANLSVSLPSGNNHVFLDHRMENVPVMTPAEAFRSLLTLYVFCTAGAQGYPSGVNNTPPVYSRVLGKTLYDTIIINMISEKEHPSVETGYDKVPWRIDKPVTPKETYVEMTLMEGLTWQPRRICLICDEDNKVRKVALQQGRNFRGNDLWRDPHVAYRCSKNGEWTSVKPQTGRALWRDIGTLLADSTNERYRPPLVVSRAADVLDSGTTLLDIRQVGLITNQASYVGWTEDRLSIPSCLIEDDLLASIIRDDVEASEYVQGVLVQCLNNRYSHDKKHSTDLAEQARLCFLSEMHDVLFAFGITDIMRFREEPTSQAIRDHIIQYHRRTEQALQNTFRIVVQASGNTAKDLRLQVEAQSEAINKFRKYTVEREERYE